MRPAEPQGPLLAERGFAVPQRPGLRLRTLADVFACAEAGKATAKDAPWCGAVRPDRMHDQTAMRTEGIAEQFRLCPRVKAEVDEGYRGLANEFPDQVSAPPRVRPTSRRPAPNPNRGEGR
jgi:hypothetical protein